MSPSTSTTPDRTTFYAPVPEQYVDLVTSMVGQRPDVEGSDPVVFDGDTKLTLFASAVPNLEGYTIAERTPECVETFAPNITTPTGAVVELEVTKCELKDGVGHYDLTTGEYFLPEFTIKRVFRDPESDEGFLTSLVRALTAALAHPVSANCCDSHTHQPQRRAAGLYRLDSTVDLLKKSEHPLAVRLLSVIESHRTGRKNAARLNLQLQLTSRGLGRIHQVDPTAFGQLEDEELIELIAAAVDSYPDASLYGALYYLVKRGTTQEEIDTALNATLTARGWDKLALDYLFRYTLDPAGPVTVEAVAGLSVDFFGQLFSSISSSDKAASLKVVYALPPAVAKGFNTTMVIDHLVARHAHRAAAEVVADEAATEVEMAAVLETLRRGGASATDQDCTTLVRRITPPFRVLLVRQEAEAQNWYFNALQAAADQTPSA